MKNIGGIAGTVVRDGSVSNSYVTGQTEDRGDVEVIGGESGIIGGLVGVNQGNILNSYAKINIRLDVELMRSRANRVSNAIKIAGGLVGRNSEGGKILNSYYADGEVLGPCVVGGLVGHQESESLDTQLLSSEIRNSYVFDANVELRHANPTVETGSTIACMLAVWSVSAIPHASSIAMWEMGLEHLEIIDGGIELQLGIRSAYQSMPWRLRKNHNTTQQFFCCR